MSSEAQEEIATSLGKEHMNVSLNQAERDIINMLYKSRGQQELESNHELQKLELRFLGNDEAQKEFLILLGMQACGRTTSPDGKNIADRIRARIEIINLRVEIAKLQAAVPASSSQQPMQPFGFFSPPQPFIQQQNGDTAANRQQSHTAPSPWRYNNG